MIYNIPLGTREMQCFPHLRALWKISNGRRGLGRLVEEAKQVAMRNEEPIM